MINPNALPQSATVQDFQNFGDDLNSPDYNDTLNAMRYMQAQRQPTGGLNRLPQVTVPMQEGGMMEEAIMQEQAPMMPEEAMLMEQVEQQDPRQPNPEARAMAQQVASYGRGGDKLILHVRPDELQGLASMLTITINPETGMPEAFLRGLRRAVSSVTKPIRRVAKSKAFKTIAPIALAIAAPWALSALAPTVFGAAGTATAFGGALGLGTVGGAAVTTGLGSLAGNLLAGRKFGDAAKAALITGATAGLTKGISNKMGGKTFWTGKTVGAEDVVKVDSVGANIKGSPSSFHHPAQQYGGQNLVSYDGGQGLLPPGNYGGVEPVGAVKDAISSTQYPTLQEALTSNVSPVEQVGGISKNQASIDFDPRAAASREAARAQAAADAAKPTFASRLGDAKDAVFEGVKDRYSGLGSFDKGAIMNLGKDVLTADLGASVVEMDNAQQQALEDQQLQAAGYSVSYPSGFGGQRVIRDSSGVVTNLTAAEILQRALGGGRMQFAPQTTFAPTAVAAQGGLIELAGGGEFSGRVPGDGGGMDDNVYMPIKEGNKQVGTLAVSPTEYVVDSYTMAALGDGSAEEGAKVMDKTVKQIRKKAFGNTKQPNEIDGLATLGPMVQGV